MISDTHGRTRAHGSLRRTSQPSKTPPTHPHDRTTARTGSKTPGGAGTHTGAYGRLLHSDVRDLTVSIERQMAEMGIKRLSVGDENGTIYLVLLVLNSSFDSKSNSLELSIPPFTDSRARCESEGTSLCRWRRPKRRREVSIECRMPRRTVQGACMGNWACGAAHALHRAPRSDFITVMM